jgi:hypothetical protein
VAADSYPVVEDGGSDPAGEERRLSKGLRREQKVSGYGAAGIPLMRTGTTFDLAAAGGSEDVRSA